MTLASSTTVSYTPESASSELRRLRATATLDGACGSSTTLDALTSPWFRLLGRVPPSLFQYDRNALMYATGNPDDPVHHLHNESPAVRSR
jgi:hypothetical protein